MWCTPQFGVFFSDSYIEAYYAERSLFCTDYVENPCHQISLKKLEPKYEFRLPRNCLGVGIGFLPHIEEFSSNFGTVFKCVLGVDHLTSFSISKDEVFQKLIKLKFG